MENFINQLYFILLILIVFFFLFLLEYSLSWSLIYCNTKEKVYGEANITKITKTEFQHNIKIHQHYIYFES